MQINFIAFYPESSCSIGNIVRNMSGVSEYGASGMGQGSKFGILSAYEVKSMRLLESDTLKTFFIRFISFP